MGSQAALCLLFQDQYPWDVRVEKFARSFSSGGYPTTIVSRNRDGLATRETLSANLRIHRLPGGTSQFLRYFLNFPAFFSPVWIRATSVAVREANAKLIVVRDLPLAPTAWLVGRRLGVPVLMDMAEDYPAMIEDTWRYRGPHALDWILRNPILLRILERWVVKHVDGVLVVSDASADRVRPMVNSARTPVWVIRNTPVLNSVRSGESSTRAPSIWAEHAGLRLLYTGGLEPSRGLATVIRSLPQLVREGHDPVVVIAGRGEGAAQLEALSAELGVSSRVRLVGWVEHAALPALIDAADVCLVPHLVTPHIETTLPNKIYDYMARGKPVVVTQSRALAGLVDRYRCGLVYTDSDPQSLVVAVRELASPQRRAILGEAGAQAVKAELRWDQDERRLIDAVTSMIEKA